MILEILQVLIIFYRFSKPSGMFSVYPFLYREGLVGPILSLLSLLLQRRIEQPSLLLFPTVDTHAGDRRAEPSIASHVRPVARQE